MVKTHGLTHISLAVRDPDASLAFYSSVFGVREYYRDEQQIQVLGPGAHDVLAFEKAESIAGRVGGITHFGFRLTRATDIDLAASEVRKAGARFCGKASLRPASRSSMSLIRMATKSRSGSNESSTHPHADGRRRSVERR